MKDDLHFLRLWDLYSPLLTETQKEITDLYFNYDLSLGEIAEQKGVSRQSVSDCLQKCRKQLEKYDEKLGFDKMLTELQNEVDGLKKELSARHYARLTEGACKVELSPYFSSVVAGLERVADHLVNVGFSILNPTGTESEEIQS